MFLLGATSPWLAIGPALIAGGIGLTSAGLSYYSAKRTLTYNATAEQARRDHERDLLILDRRLIAIETIWQSLFDLERDQQLSEQVRSDVIRAIVWLPGDAGNKVLEAVLAFEGEKSPDGNPHLSVAREILLGLTGSKEEGVS